MDAISTLDDLERVKVFLHRTVFAREPARIAELEHDIAVRIINAVLI